MDEMGRLLAAGVLPSFSGQCISGIKNSIRRNTMRLNLKKLWRDEEGQDLTEYALLVVLVALGAILAMGSLASAISNTFSIAASNLTSAST
jgi:pilus assembly protein Flp/PilA